MLINSFNNINTFLSIKKSITSLICLILNGFFNYYKTGTEDAFTVNGILKNAILLSERGGK